MTIGVAQFKSPAGALQARDWVHGQDLQQPCYAACIFAPRNLPIPDVPNATAVQQVPTVSSPEGDGHPPPTRYRVQFTVGPYLYFASTDGSPKDVQDVIGATQLYYQHVEKLPN